jgi:hypothetical protein
MELNVPTNQNTSLLAPVQTILPDPKINAVVFGSLRRKEMRMSERIHELILKIKYTSQDFMKILLRH